MILCDNGVLRNLALTTIASLAPESSEFMRRGQLDDFSHSSVLDVSSKPIKVVFRCPKIDT